MSFVFKYLFKKIWGKPPKTETVVPPTDEALIPPTDEASIPPIDEALIPPTDEAVIPPIDEASIPPTDEAVVQHTEEAIIPPTDEADNEILNATEDAGILTEEDAAIPSTDLLNLFYNYDTNLDLNELLTKASEESMLYTLKIIAHIRKTKCNGSSNFYKKTCEWLLQNHENQLIVNMQILLEKYGQWDDLAHLPSTSESLKYYIHLLSNNLKTDLDNINNGPKARSACVTKSISSIADWIQHDKNILSYVAKEMGINVKTLKKDYLKPLIKNLSLEDEASQQPSMSEKSEQIIAFNLSHHEIMMSALSDPCYDDIKCIEQSLGTNA